MRAPRRDASDLVARLSRFVVAETVGPEFIATFARVERALEGIEHALIGGQAVFFSGYERFTKDVDIGVSRPVREVARRLVRAGYVQLRGARFCDPETSIEVDVVKLPRCAIPYLRRSLRAAASPGLDMPVLPLPALIALKVKVGRAQDEADVIELIKAGSRPDRDEVVALLRSMGEPARSYDRLMERAEDELARE